MKKTLLFTLCATFVLCIGNLNAQNVRRTSGQEMSKSTATAISLQSESDVAKTPPNRDVIFSEGFEGTTGTALPTGWTIDGGTWVTVSNADYWTDPVGHCGDPFDPHSGTRMMGREWYNSGNYWVFSDGFTLAAGATYQVSFWFSAPGWPSYGEYDNFEVKIGQAANAGGMTNLIYERLNNNTAPYPYDWTQATGTFTPTTAGIYYLGFHDLNPAQTGLWILIDDIEITGDAAGGDPCPAVTNVTAALEGSNKVKVSWTAPAKALAGYEVYQDGAKITDIPAGTTEWTSDALASGTYTFAVAAVFEAADDCIPVKVAAAPIEIKTCDEKVINLTVEYAEDCSAATITWDAPDKSMSPPVEIPNIVVDKIEEYHIGETVATDRLPAAYANIYTSSVAPQFNLRAVADAYVGNTYSSPNYNSIILETGEKTYVGTMPSLLADETPTGEDYDGTDMYRITNFGRVSMISETGAATDLGNIAGTTNCVGLAYDWINQDGFFFYDATGSGTYTFTLYKLSVPSLEKTLVGVAPGSAEFRRGLALSSDGYLYSITTALSGSSNLFKVDPTNGQPTTVGSIGFPAMYGFDMVFDRVEEILYASPIDYNLTVSKLITLNTTTGASTLIYNYGLLQHAIFSCTKGEFTPPPPPPPPPTPEYNVYRDGVKIAGPLEDITTFEDITFDKLEPHTWSVAVACPTGGEGEWVDVVKDACEEGPGIKNNEMIFSIFPNPANNNITIESNTPFNKIEIVNFLGQTVISQNNNGETTNIDVSNLNGGIYFVRIISETGASVQKFVKK